jgi:hypothetical protein
MSIEHLTERVGGRKDDVQCNDIQNLYLVVHPGSHPQGPASYAEIPQRLGQGDAALFLMQSDLENGGDAVLCKPKILADIQSIAGEHREKIITLAGEGKEFGNDPQQFALLKRAIDERLAGIGLRITPDTKLFSCGEAANACCPHMTKLMRSLYELRTVPIVNLGLTDVGGPDRMDGFLRPGDYSKAEIEFRKNWDTPLEQGRWQSLLDIVARVCKKIGAMFTSLPSQEKQ